MQLERDRELGRSGRACRWQCACVRSRGHRPITLTFPTAPEPRHRAFGTPVGRSLGCRKYRGSDPPRTIEFICFGEPNRQHDHIVGFLEVSGTQNHITEMQTFVTPIFLHQDAPLGKNTKTNFNNCHPEVSGTAKNAARGAPRNLRIVT